MNCPKVSILIPVYNRENFIAPCIESALAQTFSDFEVIIVDNASADNTWNICKHYASIDSRIRVFRNVDNIGPVRNWLACIEHARGSYTKILWSDDLMHPEFLSKTIPHLDNHDIGFVYSSADMFFDNKDVVFFHSFTKVETGYYDSDYYIEAALLNQDVPYSPGCALFRTADVKTNLLLHVPNGIGSDFSMHAIGNDLLLFLLTAHQYSKFAVVKEPLSYFRMHDDSITISASSDKISLHYDLAKGFFSANYVTDKMLLKKFGAELFIRLFMGKYRKYGVKKLSDFNQKTDVNGVDYGWVVRRLGRKLLCSLKVM